MKNEKNNDELLVSVTPARDAIARHGGSVHIQVEVCPPAAPARNDRRAVALALVIDRSGSMSSAAATEPVPGLTTATDSGYPDKLSFVKAAAVRLLDLLQDGDLLSVVAFDDRVQVVKPMTRISGVNRPALGAAIRGINTGGSTNIEGALREGYGQFSDAIRKAHSCKLILLSDGEANVGEARPAVLGERAAGAAHNGVVTSTLGVGFDYNIALMAHVAEAGNGDFSHIEGLRELDRQLREELAGAAEVTAAGAEVNIYLPDGVSAGTNLNGYPQQAQAGGFCVSLGDLVRPKSFVFEISIPVEIAGEVLEIRALAEASDPHRNDLRAGGGTSVKLVSRQELEGATTDAALVRRVLGMIKASALSQASALYDGGMAAEASDGLREGTAVLDRAEDVYGDLARESADLREARAELGQMLNAVEAGVLDAMDTKRAFIRSSMVMQSRAPVSDEEDQL